MIYFLTLEGFDEFGLKKLDNYYKRYLKKKLNIRFLQGNILDHTQLSSLPISSVLLKLCKSLIPRDPRALTLTYK